MPSIPALFTVCLVLGSVVVSYFRLQETDREQQLEFGQKAFADFAPEKLESIVFQTGKDPLVLRRRVDYSWEVEAGSQSFDADEAKIRNFLVKLIRLRVGDAIPGGEDRPQAFGLSAVNGSDIPAQDGGQISLRGPKDVPVLELSLGKERKVGGGSYARFLNRPDVYLISEDFRGIRDWTFWQDKNLLDIADSDIAAIDFLALRGSPRIARASVADPWKETGAANDRGALLSPAFRKTALPGLLRSLQELQFIQLTPKRQVPGARADVPARFEQELLSKIRMELFSGKVLIVSLYKHRKDDSNLVSPYYAAFRMELITANMDRNVGIAYFTERSDFNFKTEPWFFVLDRASAERFLPHQARATEK